MGVATLKSTLYNWIVQVSGLPSGQVIFANQSEHRPPRPYATIKVAQSGSKAGTDEIRQVGAIASQCGRREALVSLHVFGSLDQSHTAFDIMEAIRNSVDQPSIVDQFFYSNDIAVVDTSDVRDLTDQSLEESTYQAHAQLDLTMAYALNQVDTGSGEIDHVTVTGSAPAGTQQIN